MGKSIESASVAADQPTVPPKDITSYPAAINYLYSRINYERIGLPPYNAGNYRLDRMRALLEILGNPQDTYKIIHIAGTKGKGTTATLIANALQASHVKTGLYTSPHLERLEERIWFDGSQISADALVQLTQSVAQVAEQLGKTEHGMPTFFELTTAMGLLYFAQSGADVVVLEVGLGGRLDSTNVCSPVMTVITPIGMDHQAQLGNTIAKIAKEKAGIIKKNVPLVCSAQDSQAQSAIMEVAKEHAVECLLIDRDFSFAWRSNPAELESGATADVLFQPTAIQLGPFEGMWKTRLLGEHQGVNIACALAALGVAASLGIPVSAPLTPPAIENTQPACRLETVSNSPLTILDTAHTPESVRAALAAIKIHFPDRRPIAVFATSKDKDYQNMLFELAEHCPQVVLTQYQGNPRGLPLPELESAAETVTNERSPGDGKTSCEFESAKLPKSAYRIAVSKCQDRELVLVIGSFFLAGELRSEFAPNQDK